MERSAFDILARENNPWNKDAKGRADMTIASRDADGIPRVKDAGKVKQKNGVKVQVMHNGLVVEENGYQGGWQAETISALKGVHEPQEEKVFYEVLKRIKNPTAMIELGAWWAYYSMWYLKSFPNARSICTEPDPVNLELGKRNMTLNEIDYDARVKFYSAASGSGKVKTAQFTTESGQLIKVPIKSVDAIITEQELKKVDILHMDIQGAEVDTLDGAIKSIDSGVVRFLFISTHHYAISENPKTHQLCREFIVKHGGHIIAEHTVLESCSGDGLIVASFDKQDKDFSVPISLQPTRDSLFRSSDYDVAILWNEYDKLAKSNHELQEDIKRQQKLIEEKDQFINEITPLRRHVKRQIRHRINKT
ncbi:MAG: hypothetical protein JWM00_153 [Candidatus Saccharibacteria bacterium]|nr:hypothetical protein [Candidatus Saccharibacteria bacterium]